MTKDDYLNLPNVSGFVRFLKYLVNGGAIDCRYVPAKERDNPFVVNTLEEAMVNYRWNKADYQETKETLGSLRAQIASARNEGDPGAALLSSLEILVWGEVYKGSAGWIARAARQGELLEKINRAVGYFDGDSDSRTNMFEKNADLRSDSGTTKIFSLASNSSVIYDDRVACALGMLLIDYLDHERVMGVPEELNFLMGGPASGRNPGYTARKFEYKRSGVDVGALHARSNLRANWIIQELVESDDFHWAGVGGELSEKMRAFEAALFMLGYKAYKDKYSDRGYYLVIP